MNILLIEDEHLSAEDLAETITLIDHTINILAIKHSVKEAVEYLRTKPDIDLIFSDIQLGDGLSFEIFKTESVDVPIIFCTAYDEYAIEAFKNNGIDYIMKPFDDTVIKKALDRYQKLKVHFMPVPVDYNALIQSLTRTNANDQSAILVQQKNGVLPVRLKDIALFYIDNDVARLLCFNQENYIINQTLDQLEKTGGDAFFRANRQYLINREAVTSATNYFPRKYLVNISVPFSGAIIISKTRSSAFFSWLVQK